MTMVGRARGKRDKKIDTFQPYKNQRFICNTLTHISPSKQAMRSYCGSRAKSSQAKAPEEGMEQGLLGEWPNERGVLRWCVLGGF